MAERLIGLYDTQEPEVLLELEVLEVRSTRLTELGIKVPNTVSLATSTRLGRCTHDRQPAGPGRRAYRRLGRRHHAQPAP